MHPNATKVLQPKHNEIWQVVSEARCTHHKLVIRDGRAWAFKFFYSNGAILYVPLPDSAWENDQSDFTLGPITN